MWTDILTIDFLDKIGYNIKTDNPNRNQHTMPKHLDPILYPAPKVLAAKGLKSDEWEVLLNADIQELRAVIVALFSRGSKADKLVYPIDKDIAPPKYFPGNPPKYERIKYQIPLDDPNFKPPFHINDRHPPWPFDLMEIGDSFVAPKKLQTALGNYRTAAIHKGRNVCFVSRTINEQWIRIWCLHMNYGPNNNGLVTRATANDVRNILDLQQTETRRKEALDARKQPPVNPVELAEAYGKDILNDPTMQSPEVRAALLRQMEIKKQRAQGVKFSDVKGKIPEK